MPARGEALLAAWHWWGGRCCQAKDLCVGLIASASAQAETKPFALGQEGKSWFLVSEGPVGNESFMLQCGGYRWVSKRVLRKQEWCLDEEDGLVVVLFGWFVYFASAVTLT